MENKREKEFLISFYKDELTDMEFYNRLAKTTNDKDFKEKLFFLAGIEKSHSEYWGQKLTEYGEKIERFRYKKLRVTLLYFLSFILGKTLTINLLERGEVESIIKYKKFKNSLKNEQIKSALDKIIEDELSHENVFNSMNETTEQFLDRIQATIYGMSDGLVEVLAAVAGLTGIIQNDFIIGLAGIVVSLGGTISMSLGSFLSKSSESEFRISNIKRENILNNENKSDEIKEQKKRSTNSALYTGFSYILGAIFPVFPFFIGIGNYAIILSVVLVAAVQGITSSIIAISLNTSIWKSVSRASILSVLAALATYIIGITFHIYFHISVL